MPADYEKARHRNRRNAARRERKVRVAAKWSMHCRCDYCVVPYARHEKHRHTIHLLTKEND